MPTKPRVPVNGLPDLRCKANGAATRNPKYRCATCHIKIPVVSGLCDDCEKGAPYITWADRMGADRFFLMCRPVPARGQSAHRAAQCETKRPRGKRNMEMDQTLTTVSTDMPAQPSYLLALAAQLKRAAQGAPNVPMYPSRPLKNGAHLMLKCDGTRWLLRIARHGLSPLNDLSKDGSRRLGLWRRELATFARAFEVPAGLEPLDGARELLYYADFVWSVE